MGTSNASRLMFFISTSKVTLLVNLCLWHSSETIFYCSLLVAVHPHYKKDQPSGDIQASEIDLFCG